MKRFSKLFIAGVAIIAILFILDVYCFEMPDIVKGVAYGIGIGMELLGIYTMKKKISWKKVFGK